jgi:hypothetical protein
MEQRLRREFLMEMRAKGKLEHPPPTEAREQHVGVCGAHVLDSKSITGSHALLVECEFRNGHFSTPGSACFHRAMTRKRGPKTAYLRRQTATFRMGSKPPAAYRMGAELQQFPPAGSKPSQRPAQAVSIRAGKTYR